MRLFKIIFQILDQLFFVRELIQFCIKVKVVVSCKFIIEFWLLHALPRIFLNIFLFVPHEPTLFVELGSFTNSLYRLVQTMLNTGQKLEVCTILVFLALKLLYFTIVFDRSSNEIASHIFDDYLVVTRLVGLTSLNQIE